jgi:phage-related protein (TIGR01555 family)
VAPARDLPTARRGTREVAVAIIHETRLVQFGGVLTPPDEKAAQLGRDDSVLRAVWPVLQQVNGNWGSICAMLQDLSQIVIKMQGVVKAVAAGKAADIQKRIELLDMARSSVRAILLDAENEDFDVVERTALAGMSNVLDTIFLRLSSAARMPVSRLLGQAPAGLNATGEGDRMTWHDQVREYERDSAVPPLLLLARRVGKQLFPAVDPEEWQAEFGSLEHETATIQAQSRLAVAQADAIYLDRGVVRPAEIALSRFGRGCWSPDYTLDMDVREQILPDELEALVLEAEKAANPPPPAAGQDPNALPGTDGNAPPAPASAAAVQGASGQGQG